jgi:hypothetical protein
MEIELEPGFRAVLEQRLARRHASASEYDRHKHQGASRQSMHHVSSTMRE